MGSSLKYLPAGFRLKAKDEVLIEWHLWRKLRNEPEEYCLIPVFDIYDCHPWDLISKYTELSSITCNGVECFFFCTVKKNPKGHKIRTTVGGEGHWHETGNGRPPQDSDKLKWEKRIFSYRLGKQNNAKPTDWVMHEFRIISDERFVLCRITKRPQKQNAPAGSISAGRSQKRRAAQNQNESSQEATLEQCVRGRVNRKKNKQDEEACRISTSSDLLQTHEETSQGTIPQASDYVNMDQTHITIPPSDSNLLEYPPMPMDTLDILTGLPVMSPEPEYFGDEFAWIMPETHLQICVSDYGY